MWVDVFFLNTVYIDFRFIQIHNRSRSKWNVCLSIRVGCRRRQRACDLSRPTGHRSTIRSVSYTCDYCTTQYDLAVIWLRLSCELLRSAITYRLVQRIINELIRLCCSFIRCKLSSLKACRRATKVNWTELMVVSCVSISDKTELSWNVSSVATIQFIPAQLSSFPSLCTRLHSVSFCYSQRAADRPVVDYADQFMSACQNILMAFLRYSWTIVSHTAWIGKFAAICTRSFDRRYWHVSHSHES